MCTKLPCFHASFLCHNPCATSPTFSGGMCGLCLSYHCFFLIKHLAGLMSPPWTRYEIGYCPFYFTNEPLFCQIESCLLCQFCEAGALCTLVVNCPNPVWQNTLIHNKLHEVDLLPSDGQQGTAQAWDVLLLVHEVAESCPGQTESYVWVLHLFFTIAERPQKHPSWILYPDNTWLAALKC